LRGKWNPPDSVLIPEKRTNRTGERAVTAQKKHDPAPEDEKNLSQPQCGYRSPSSNFPGYTEVRSAKADGACRPTLKMGSQDVNVRFLLCVQSRHRAL